MLGAFGIARDVVAISPSELHSAEREGELVEIDGVPSWWRVEVGQRRWGSCAAPVLHEDPPPPRRCVQPGAVDAERGGRMGIP